MTSTVLAVVFGVCVIALGILVYIARVADVPVFCARCGSQLAHREATCLACGRKPSSRRRS